MSNKSSEPLKGKALLEKLQTLEKLPHRDRAKQCRYYTSVLMNDGQMKLRLNLSEFYDAIVAARAEEKQSRMQEKTKFRVSTPNNLDQPGEFDAVLGDRSIPPPFHGMVLGGMEGVKSRLNSTSVEVRVVALKEALNYGEAGLDLAIAALKDSSKLVQSSAYQLLWERQEQKVKQAISKCDPTLLFTTLSNWDIKQFTSQTGITEPFSSAYVVNFEWLELILESEQPSQVSALVWRSSYETYRPKKRYTYLVDALFDASDYLSKLKVLCIEASEISLGDLSLILKAYPHLELLQISTTNNDITISSTCHYQLKTLIISKANIAQICYLNLPELEHLNLSMDNIAYDDNPDISLLTPILSCKTFPNLKHLGLCNNNYKDKVAYALVKSLLVHRLLSLDLSDGGLGDKGAEALINSLPINRLRILNLSRNFLSRDMVKRFSHLRGKVITTAQKSHYYHRYNSVWE